MSRNIYYSLKEASQAVADKISREILTKYLDKETNRLTKTVDDIKKEYSQYDDADIELGYNTALERLNSQSNEQTKEDNDNAQEKPKLTPEQEKVGNKIVEVLASYNVDVELVGAKKGPNVTQYEFKLAPGTKISEVENLNKEIAMGLAVKSVAIGQVEGTSYLGIQVPNEQVDNVPLDSVLENSKKEGLSVGLGVNLKGEAVSGDILKLQHILIGGTTGSGKSACINSMICSLLKEYTPDQVKLVLIDPKRVELAPYKSVPHLLMPIVTDPKAASDTLKELCSVMDKRFSTFEKTGVKSIESYNNLVMKAREAGRDVKLMPYVVVVIDELADLMVTAGKEVESSIQRLTQLARAAGIHLIVATQRPSVDVVTGVIKSNINSRIAFNTPSSVDSRTILDQTGAEKLLGKGDMLYKPMGSSNPTRLQGALVSDDEIEQIVKETNEKYKANEPEETVQETDKEENIVNLYDKAVEIARRDKKVSTANLQLELHIPYSKAKELIQKMEDDGIIKTKGNLFRRRVVK